MENSSTKRGRPYKLHPGWEAELRKGLPSGAYLSRRTVMNRDYYYHAVVALKDRPELHPVFGLRAAKGRYVSVLTEIGRLGDPEAMVEAAEWFARERPTAREAIATIRRWRCKASGRKQQTAGNLAGELLRVVNDYLGRYPATTWEQAIHAIEIVLIACKAQTQQKGEATT